MTDPLARCQASLAIARDGALDTVLRLTARLAEQQAELARLRAALRQIASRGLQPAAGHDSAHGERVPGDAGADTGAGASGRVVQ